MQYYATLYHSSHVHACVMPHEVYTGVKRYTHLQDMMCYVIHMVHDNAILPHPHPPPFTP